MLEGTGSTVYGKAAFNFFRPHTLPLIIAGEANQARILLHVTE